MLLKPDWSLVMGGANDVVSVVTDPPSRLVVLGSSVVTSSDVVCGTCVVVS